MRYLILVILFCLLCSNTSAVIIKGGDGTGNTTAPSDFLGDPGFANVGKGNYSSTYLGDRWVLTCAHCGTANTSIFNGITYNLISGSSTRLHQSMGSSSLIDLLMYRIDGEPALNDIIINDESPTQTSLVTMIGLGLERGTETSTGWLWGSSLNTKRWGRNIITSSESYPMSFGYGTGYVYETIFHKTPSLNLDPNLSFNECQAASGDSGGAAVFSKEDNIWKLSGVIEAVSNSGAANYGNTTYIIDVSYYKDQIDATRLTCPFQGTISNPEIKLGANTNSTLVSDGGFTFTNSGECSVSVDTKAYTLIINTDNYTITETGNLTGNFIKRGNGELILEGDNTFTDLIVNQGTLTTTSLIADSLTIGGSVTCVPEPSSLILICIFILVVIYVKAYRP
jgi:autotransporter-associated beta strand protein